MTLSRRAFMTAVSTTTAAAVLSPFSSAFAQGSATQLRVRLGWYPQAEYAGFLVAEQLGFYKAENLDVEILGSGPDLRPTSTVASGTDNIGIATANDVILARGNSAPLRIIAQIFQDSEFRFVLKSTDKISRLEDLRGKKVGIWLGGDQAEFVCMLDTAKMTMSDMTVIPQQFSVAPFLNNEYILSEVTPFNELLQIEDAGYGGGQATDIESC